MSKREAKAMAAAVREAIVIMDTPIGLKRSATSADDDEPSMNKAIPAAREGHDIFAGPLWRSVVRSCRCARMAPPHMSPRETKDVYSSKIIVRSCGVGFCRAGGDRAGAGPDHAGMQREISSRQVRRHA